MTADRSAREAHAVSQKRKATVNLRLAEHTKRLIDEAAAALGKTRTEFMIDSARQRAVDTLLDRRIIELDAEGWDRFVAALEDPPPPTEALRKLMRKRLV